MDVPYTMFQFWLCINVVQQWIYYTIKCSPDRDTSKKRPKKMNLIQAHWMSKSLFLSLCLYLSLIFFFFFMDEIEIENVGWTNTIPHHNHTNANTTKLFLSFFLPAFAHKKKRCFKNWKWNFGNKERGVRNLFCYWNTVVCVSETEPHKIVCRQSKYGKKKTHTPLTHTHKHQYRHTERIHSEQIKPQTAKDKPNRQKLLHSSSCTRKNREGETLHTVLIVYTYIL